MHVILAIILYDIFYTLHNLTNQKLKINTTIIDKVIRHISLFLTRLVTVSCTTCKVFKRQLPTIVRFILNGHVNRQLEIDAIVL